MRHLVRAAAVFGLVAGLLPTAVSAHHTPGGPCQDAPASVTRGYIPVAQNSPTEATTLHYQLILPNKELFGEGPFHAVMDYSGYQPGITIFDSLHRHFLCQGYAVIGLNIRGTGCSGGKFDYFEPRQAEDGRQAIKWFGDHAAELGLTGRIAMVGKSYPGITQLFVAGQPMNAGGTPAVPDNLVAIVPGAVFGDLYRDVPFPGGIMNVTFAAGWSAGRIYEPFTAPFVDHQAIQKGDQQCIRNAAEHVQNPPFNPFVKATYNQYDGPLFHERSPWYWADNISMPTFLFETWQDEQVGSRATELIERFNKNLEWRFLGTNGDHGGHGDYYGSHVMPKIDEFLRFYLAQEIPPAYQGGTVTEPVPQPSPSPSSTPTNPNGKPKKPKKNAPAPSPTASPSPSTTTRPETYAEALARYEAENPVQINWENGALGERTPAWIKTYASWPPPNQEVWRLHFTAGGKLVDEAPTAPGALSYRYQPGSSQQRGGYKLTSAVPTVPDTHPASWDERPQAGTFLMFESDAFASDKILAGTASVDLWLSSTAPDTDLQTTLTEVRPDGKEVFVQQSWLRASHRKEDAASSTTLRPFHTHRLEDVQALIPGQPAKMRIEIFPFAHPFRAGSKLRLYIEAPHVKPDLWGFALLPTPAQNTIHIGPTQPSSIALPLLNGETVPADAGAYPPCVLTGLSGLRNQPCRDVR
jgi:uncharacterized protein